ncbi:MAG: methyltransferase domain-containing protein [Halioglobus sp.]
MATRSKDIFSDLDSWYSGSNGEYLLENLKRNIDKSLETAFGYHLLQLGITRRHALFDSININHRVYGSERSGDQVGLIANNGELPLESDSIDVLIAHHSLEFEDDPHQALREMQRVLAPQGHLIIIGFNRFSAFGASTFLKGRSRKSTWHHHQPVNPLRASDWLRLLGCEVQDCAHLYALPPIGGGRLRNAMMNCDAWLSEHNVPVGGLYVMHAINQVPRLHRPRRRLLPVRKRLMGLAVPTTSVGSNSTTSTTLHSEKQGETIV